MRVFFLAEKLCAVTVNGLFLGYADGFERSVELDPADGCFVECKPAGFHPVRFRFDGDFLFAPPPHIELYHTRQGAAIYCRGFLREDAGMRVVRQQRIADTLFTLFVQESVQLSAENETGFHLMTLPDAFEDASFCEAGEVFLIEGKDAFLLLSRAGEKLVLSEGRVTKRGREIAAEIPYHDSMGHTALCVYENGALVRRSIRARREASSAAYALALFECVRADADCTPFLAPSIAEKAGALKEFLGDYLSVVLTEKGEEVGLVYRRKENVFDVRYFRVSFEDGKISNISPME